jgi:hypothetical protein
LSGRASERDFQRDLAMKTDANQSFASKISVRYNLRLQIPRVIWSLAGHLTT